MSNTNRKTRLPIIVPRKRVHDKPEEVPCRVAYPDLKAEIEFRKSRYPTISLGKRTSVTHDNKNKIIIEQLGKLVEHIENQIRSSEIPEDRKKHGFRLSSIKKGIQVIREHPEEILSGRQAQQLKGIGKGISERIDEIIKNKSPRSLSSCPLDLVELGAQGVPLGQPKDTAYVIGELTTVSGIGVVKAREIMLKYKLNGVTDLIQRWQEGSIKEGISHHIEVGLRWYYDIRQPIPREEMDIYASRLHTIGKSIDPYLQIQICGSYRRGKSQSNDIDVLLTTSSENKVCDKKYLPLLLDVLVEQKIIVDSMTDYKKNPTKYMGISKITEFSIARRIDIRFVTYESWASGQMYFTGSGT
ncbi:MAG: hypothetical protein WD512_04075, partial [Candidatus Paceibacterota bacterium]